ncbi:hypothetical protein [Sulfurimonas sp.]|uniref:hypothetical protein n=1 Tax=Sulfurimonas sp. TaxID=2022749 RepID=UPI0025D633C4|nr:hypothetical protein [Sulfurimonas sp.]
MKAKAKEMGFDPSLFMQKQEKPKFTIKKTGKRVNVGGIKGEEWIVKGKQDGKNYESKVVVTSDKNVVKTMRAMFSSMSDMTGGMVSGDNPFEMKKGYVVIKADGMKLESFKSKSLSSNVYKLPKVTNTREAFNERNKRSDQPRKSTKKRVVAKDTLACYDNLCCGKVAGESVVLKPAIYKNKGGTGSFIVDSATCKKNALGQTTEVVIIEDSATGHLIHLKLILNDKSKGIVQKLIDDQTDYAGNDSTIVRQEQLNIGGSKAMYIHSRNTNQQRMDVYLPNNATLSMARMHKDDWARSFQGWAEKGWIFYSDLKQNVKNWNPSKPIPAKKASNYTSRASHKKAKVEEVQEVEEDSGISDNDVDKAVDLLKSFF